MLADYGSLKVPMENSDDKEPSVQRGKTIFLAKLATAVATAAANLLPGGGVAASLLSAYTAEATNARLQKQLRDVEAKLTALGTTIDELTEQRQEHIFRFFDEARKSLDQEKLQRLQNATVNAFLTDIEDMWFAQLEECVIQMSTDEVAVLTALYRLRPYEERNDAGEVVYTAPGISLEDLAREIPQLPLELLSVFVRRLARFSLLEQVVPQPDPIYGVQLRDHLHQTALGTRFLWLVSDPQAR